MTRPKCDKELKKYQKECLRQKMMDEVCTMANAEGWETISTRKLAEKIDYSTIKIYEEFGSKEGILVELQKTGFLELRSYVSRAEEKSTVPVEKIRNVSQAVWEFANSKPESFQIMFGIKGAPCTESLSKNTHEYRQFLIGKLVEAYPDGSKSLLFNWCVLIYGFISIGTEKCFCREEMDQMFTEAIDRFLSTIE